MEKARTEYRKYQAQTLSPVEEAYLEQQYSGKTLTAKTPRGIFVGIRHSVYIREIRK